MSENGYWGEVKAIGAALGRMARRAEADILPTTQGVWELAKKQASRAHTAFDSGLAGLSDLISPSEDTWVAAIPMDERTPARLLENPNLEIFEEDGDGVVWDRAVTTVWFVVSDSPFSEAGGPIEAAVLRLKIPVNDAGEVLAYTPVLTVQRVSVRPIDGSVDAALVYEALTRLVPNHRTLVYVEDERVLDRAAALTSPRYVALSRLSKGVADPVSQEDAVAVGWKAFDEVVTQTGAVLADLDGMGPDFDAEGVLVRAVVAIGHEL